MTIEEIKELKGMDHPKKEYASKGMAGTALGFGIGGAALALLNNGGLNLFGNKGTRSVSEGGCALTCQDKIELTSAIYQGRITELNERFADRQTINGEMFGIYKSQIDADFNLYKGQRDSFDVLQKEISDLKAHIAVTDAIQPYQMKLVQCEIDNVRKEAAWNLERTDCRNIKGIIGLPQVPTVAVFPSRMCGCASVPTTPEE